MMNVRLNKYLADCTGISRRKADAWIAEGKVRVNRRPAQVGQTINSQSDHVWLDGKPVLPQRKLYVAFYKPAGYLTTRSDPEGRKTFYDLLPQKYQHLDPAGRLDRESSGLLLLTNDGDLLYRLTHPQFEHAKMYKVTVNKTLTPEVLQKLEAGILLQPEDRLAHARVMEIRDMKSVVLSLTTGMNRQIRRSFEALGYEVVRLKRVSFAGVALGQLRPGKARELKPSELTALKRLAGMGPSKGKARPKRLPRSK